MAVFRHLKCCDGWSFFVFLYSRWVLKRWVSCLLKWKRDRGSILRCRTVGEEKEKILLSSRKRKREKYCWSSEKSFSGFGVGRLLLNARSLLILWYHSSSCLCSWSVWCRNRRFECWEMTVLVLKTLSDLGCGNSRWNEELHFSVDETFFERRNNPLQFVVRSKISFPVLLSSDGGKIFYFITCIIFGVDDENKVDQSLIFFFLPAFLQGRMTSWDWSLRRRYWKLFNWSFRGWRWSGRRCASRILIVE